MRWVFVRGPWSWRCLRRFRLKSVFRRLWLGPWWFPSSACFPSNRRRRWGWLLDRLLCSRLRKLRVSSDQRLKFDGKQSIIKKRIVDSVISFCMFFDTFTDNGNRYLYWCTNNKKNVSCESYRFINFGNVYFDLHKYFSILNIILSIVSIFDFGLSRYRFNFILFLVLFFFSINHTIYNTKII